jgi:crotonyl-CoA carboxylase/reductase
VRPVPEVGDYDVLVQVMAASLNFNASWAAMGSPVSTFSFPRVKHHDFQVLGSDAAGIVLKVGDSVTKARVGDHVVMATGEDDREESDPESGDSMQKKSFHITGYENPHGTFAQFVRLDERQVLPKPADLSWEDAASYMLVGATAWRALKNRVGVKKGDTVLVWGGAKGTGAYAVQIARYLGAHKVIAVVSSEGGAALARSFGATATINRTELPEAVWGEVPADPSARIKWEQNAHAFVQNFLATTGGEYADVVVEHPGAQTYPLSVSVLKNTGRVTHYAGTTGYKFTFIGKENKQSHHEILKEAGLNAGMRVVVYGADSTAHQIFELIKKSKAKVVCVTRGHNEDSLVRSWDADGTTLVGTVDLSKLTLPTDMPAPPHPDLTIDDASNYELYRSNTLNAFRNAIRHQFQGSLPDLIIERAHQHNTLDLSVFTVKPHGTVAYVESTAGFRYAFDARYVWMFQKRILPWIIGSHFASYDETEEFNTLVLNGAIRVPDVEAFSWPDLPIAQQRMLDGQLQKAKTSVLIGAREAGQRGASPPKSGELEDDFPPIVYRVSRTIRITDQHVREMISLSGDDNPVHLSDRAARVANFDGRIAHGMLVGSLVPKFLSELGWLRLGSIVRMEYSFVRPVYIDSRDNLRVVVEVRGIQLRNNKALLDIRCVIEKHFQRSRRWEEVLVGTLFLNLKADDLHGLVDLTRTLAVDSRDTCQLEL